MMSWFRCHPAAMRVHKLQPSGLYALCGASSCSSTRHFRVTEEEITKARDTGQLCPRCIKQISIDLLKDTVVKIPVSATPVTPEWADEEKK